VQIQNPQSNIQHFPQLASSFDEGRIDPGLVKGGVVEYLLMYRNGRLYASMCNSLKARFMQAMASCRVGWWTISLPINES